MKAGAAVDEPSVVSGRLTRHTTMSRRSWALVWLAGALASVALAIPASLVDEIKSSELRENKVKRAHSELVAPNPEQNNDEVGYFNKPTAIKRGTNLKDQPQDQQALNEWEQEQNMFRNQFNLDNIQSGLFNSDNFDDKTLAEYEKGFRYGTNKDKLDEALENAVLKSELYGDPTGPNQYRYYGVDDKKRKRRDTRKLRIKRELDLSPEEVLALLTLYENNRQQADSDNYRQPWTHYPKNYDLPLDENDGASDDDWLDGPVVPHPGRQDVYGAPYDDNQVYEKKTRWNSVADKKKRFMVAKKRSNDPTRMLRYINGPNENDFNTLSKLLNNQREPKMNVPVYRRLVL